jgi:hypothetical protein
LHLALFQAAILLVILALLLGISASVALQARRRGYRFLVWLIAGALGNPLFFLVMLSIMPDFARKALRSKETADLEAKLAALPTGGPSPPTLSLILPSPGASAHSVGDLPTVLPQQQSVGDRETQG